MADLSWTARVGADLDPAALWDDYRPTGLIELPRLADLAKVGRVFVKLEGSALWAISNRWVGWRLGCAPSPATRACGHLGN